MYFVKEDQIERYNQRRAWFRKAYRIVDKDGVDKIQPWFTSMRDLRETAAALKLDVVDVNVRIYDSGDKTYDRFTAVFLNRPENRGLFECFGMSGPPYGPCHPQGYGMHSSAMPGRHLGKRIKFTDLPAECQRALINA